MPGTTENKQTLTASVLPDQTIVLEWADTRQYLPRTRLRLEADLYAAYSSGDRQAWLLTAGFSEKNIPLDASLDFFRGVAGDFAEAVCRIPEIEELRERILVSPDPADLDNRLENLPPMPGAEYMDHRLLGNLWQRLNEALSRSLLTWPGSVESWIRDMRPEARLVGRVFFHLVENTRNGEPFAFLATYSTGVDPATGRSRHVPLKHALETYKNNQDELFHLLATVYRAAGESALVADLIETGDLFHPLFWSSKKAFTFLSEIPVYEAAGILCRIPDWWKAKNVAVRMDVSLGHTGPSHVGLEALISLRPRLMIGEEELSPDEARRLLEEAEGLAFIKNKWVAVDRGRLEQTLAVYEKAAALAGRGGLTLKEALRLELHPEKIFGPDLDEADYSVSNGEWLQTVFEKLRRPVCLERVSPSGRFKAALRPYQQDGLNWLHFHARIGFGACLADDMGLGKTIQLLALLDVLRHDAGAVSAAASAAGDSDSAGGNSPATDLLIVPASLLANWAAEIDRFSPDLKYRVAHPAMSDNQGQAAWSEMSPDGYELIITTYAMVQRHDRLKARFWRYVILDEAQAIKNASTKQTRAVKALTAGNRIILTGTPIENRLSDLWSLFDFLNPGLLGSAAEFKAYLKQLDRGEKDHAGLRRLVRPFILRRLKSDRDIISDLPDKVEMNTYAGLTSKQRLLYVRLVDDLAAAVENAEGIQRKGLVLASLMKFKQLCNHPDQYLGTGAFAEADSGKFARLREICEIIREKRERVLVFTQFREIVGPLADFLARVFERPGLFIHGSVPVGERKKRVEQFQADAYTPFMVLSLKAGGVGLNLTRAAHVVHFDRWWNPAVENQATDRAFRIGQKSNVMVHKFITRGTVEEKIDQMLLSKTAIAEDVIGNTGQAWITEMDNQTLIDMFRPGLPSTM